MPPVADRQVDQSGQHRVAPRLRGLLGLGLLDAALQLLEAGASTAMTISSLVGNWW